MLTIVAWTGGDKPGPYPPSDPREKELCDQIYAQECKVYQDYWGTEVPENIKEGFMVWARYDAFATIREVKE